MYGTMRLPTEESRVLYEHPAMTAAMQHQHQQSSWPQTDSSLRRRLGCLVDAGATRFCFSSLFCSATVLLSFPAAAFAVLLLFLLLFSPSIQARSSAVSVTVLQQGRGVPRLFSSSFTAAFHSHHYVHCHDEISAASRGRVRPRSSSTGLGWNGKIPSQAQPRSRRLPQAAFPIPWLLGTSSSSAIFLSSSSSSNDIIPPPPTSASPINHDITPPNRPYTELCNIDRVFCLSDLHTDHVDNMKWLQHRMQQQQQSTSFVTLTERDLVVVAGDISHHMDTFAKTLQILRGCGCLSSNHHKHKSCSSRSVGGCQVFFVPGNHEAWMKSSKDPSQDSLDKLQRIQQICQDYGVHTGPLRIVVTNQNNNNNNKNNNNNTTVTWSSQQHDRSLWILPLECWYDGSLSFSEDLCQDFATWPWMDFQQCVWPVDQFPPGTTREGSGGAAAAAAVDYRIPQGLVPYFLQQNQRRLESSLQSIRSLSLWSTSQDDTTTTRATNNTNTMVMTVSHFLPNQQCLPDWKDLNATTFDLDNWLDHGGGETSAKFAKVAGSQLLDQQLRSMFSFLNQSSTWLSAPSSSSSLSSSSSSLNYSHLHVFGHSHRPKDFVYQGVRYVHNPLGKPRERNLNMISPNVDFQLLWQADQGPVHGTKTILRYWDEFGGGKESTVASITGIAAVVLQTTATATTRTTTTTTTTTTSSATKQTTAATRTRTIAGTTTQPKPSVTKWRQRFPATIWGVSRILHAY